MKLPFHFTSYILHTYVSTWTMINIHREQKTEDEEEQTEDDVSREQRRQRRIERVEKRCQEKAKKFLTSDRLLEDKTYLTNLSRGLFQYQTYKINKLFQIATYTFFGLYFLQELVQNLVLILMTSN